MKKLTVFLAILLLVGCVNPAQKPNTEEKEVVNEVRIPKANVTLALPPDYTIAKNTEINRRGSFASYDFNLQQGGNEPVFQEIQFFSESSIKDFTEKCTDETPCFFGNYPTPERYKGQKNALLKRENYSTYQFRQFNDRNYLVSSFPCVGDNCRIREYTTFIGDTKIDIWINMPNDVTEQQADDLFEEFKMTEDGPVDTFIFDETKGAYYGKLVVKGYAVVRQQPQVFYDTNCPVFDYVFFNILETDNKFIDKFIAERQGNSFVGEASVGIGCVQDGIVWRWNASDEFGMQKYTDTPAVSEAVLSSSVQNPVTVEIERLLYTSGQGAPDCYSHFSRVSKK